MINRKKIIRFSVIGVVVLIVFLVIAKKAGWIGKEEITKVATEYVQKRTIVETVSANGKIQPEVEVKMTPDVSGEIVTLNVKEGDPVKAGDLLARIDPEIYSSNLDRIIASLNTQKSTFANSKARLAQVKAQFINAKSSYERSVQLWKSKTISPSEYDNAQSAYEVAKAEVDAAEQSVKGAEYGVKSAEAAVKEARENLAKTSIFAPVDGTISKLNVEKGERVVGTSQFAGTEIMRIANLSSMEVNVSVNENDIVRVKIGDTALIEVDSYLNRKFKGLVTEIATSANTTGLSADQVTNFDVKIRILKESYKDLIPKGDTEKSPFRPGMSATVDIQTKAEVNTLSIPIQAVTTRADSAKIKQNQVISREKPKTGEESISPKTNEPLQEYVFLYVGGKVKMQKVKTGIQDNMYIQVVQGLKVKDEVVTAPYKAVTKKLKDGDAVKKVDKEQLFSQEK
ncbi:MAG: efflux RND transporter periplasmic adaptor subunit [Lentimicrobiaceae bacterium]|nr:efflux RND transporter periplasmic adaptor subunit [Lentimicrobiaceae bacterium]